MDHVNNSPKNKFGNFVATLQHLDTTQKFTLVTVIVFAVFVFPFSLIAVKNRVNLRTRAHEIVSPPTPPNDGNHPPLLVMRLRNAIAGQYYEAPIFGQDRDSGETLTISATTVPNGLEITQCTETDSRSGSRVSCTLAGTIEDPGDYEVTLTITDTAGLSDTRTAQLVVE